MMVQEKNIRERNYNEALFTLDVFNNRELSPVPSCSLVQGCIQMGGKYRQRPKRAEPKEADANLTCGKCEKDI